MRGFTDPWIDSNLAEEIKCACAAAQFVSLHTHPLHWQWDPQGLRDEIDLCRLIGAQTLVLHPGSLSLESPSSNPDIPGIVRLSAYGKKHGVRLALENTPNSMWALDLIVDAVGDDPYKTNLGICIDVGHAHISEDAGREPIKNYLERFRGQLIHLHLHDNDGTNDDHDPPGKGTIDWRSLSRTIADIDYQGTATLELRTGEEPSSEFISARDFIVSLA
jgi:sugar phosphate isomerase/epimerase